MQSSDALFEHTPGVLRGRPTTCLDDLYWRLRTKYMDVTIEQLAASNDLLLDLAGREVFPETVTELADWLTPIFATNPAEQASIHRDICGFLERERDRPVELARQRGHAGKTAQQRKEVPAVEEIQRRSWRNLPWLLALAALAVAVAVAVQYQPPDEVKPLWTVAPVPKPLPPTEVEEKPPDTEEAGTIDPADIPITLPSAAFSLEFVLARGLLVAAPLAIMAALLLYWLIQRWYWLRAGRNANTEQVDDLLVRSTASAVHRYEPLHRAILKLRRRFPVLSRRVDVERTVDAVAKSGALADIRYADLSFQPEYLILIEQLGTADHQAHLFIDLARRLAAEQTNVEIYIFAGDPTYCHLIGYPDTMRRLDLVLAQFPGCRVVIASASESLLDPRKGATTPWLTYLEERQFKALLTPRDVASWGRMELTLTAAEWLVLPATLDGVRMLAQRVENAFTQRLWFGAHVNPDADRRPPLPEWLTSGSERWLHGTWFARAELDELCDDLYFYFGLTGDPLGFQWLAACAVFPSLYWNFSLDIGHLLAGHLKIDPPDHDDILSLARLAWFREGYIPAPIRQRLIAELDDDTKALLRRSFAVMLSTSLSEDDTVLRLDPDRDPDPKHEERTRKLLRHLANDAELNDDVFLDFMLEREPAAKEDAPERRRRAGAAPGWFSASTIWRPSAITMAGLALAGQMWLEAQTITELAGIATRQSVPLADAISLHQRWLNSDGNEGLRLELIDQSISKANLTAADLRQAIVTNTTLDRVSLAGADLGQSEWTGSTLSNSRLEGANFNRAALTDTSLLDSDARLADFSSAALADMDLSGSLLDRAQWDAICANMSSSTATRAPASNSGEWLADACSTRVVSGPLQEQIQAIEAELGQIERLVGSIADWVTRLNTLTDSEEISAQLLDFERAGSQVLSRLDQADRRIEELATLEANGTGITGSVALAGQIVELSARASDLRSRFENAVAELKVSGAAAEPPQGAENAFERNVMSADQVKDAQARLCVEPDGVFGEPTRGAIRLFEEATSRDVTGRIETIAELDALLKSATCVDSAMGWRNAYEKFAYADEQAFRSLKTLLLDVLAAIVKADDKAGAAAVYDGLQASDARFDAVTRDAIAFIQAHLGLAPTAEVTPQFLRDLVEPTPPDQTQLQLQQVEKATSELRLDDIFTRLRSDEVNVRRSARSELAKKLAGVVDIRLQAALIEYMIAKVDVNARDGYLQALGVVVALGETSSGWSATEHAYSEIRRFGAEFASDSTFPDDLRRALENARRIEQTAN